MVCRREVVLNIHHLKYIDKELGREAISIFFYEFAGGLTLATQESKKRRATSATYMPFVGTVYLILMSKLVIKKRMSFRFWFLMNSQIMLIHTDIRDSLTGNSWTLLTVFRSFIGSLRNVDTCASCCTSRLLMLDSRSPCGLYGRVYGHLVDLLQVSGDWCELWGPSRKVVQRFGLLCPQFWLGFHYRRLQMPTYPHWACGVFRHRTAPESACAEFLLRL